MKLHIAISRVCAFSCLVFLASCSLGQSSKDVLPVTEFYKQITAAHTPVIVDVRTPGEYAKGHLVNARNINVNADDFETEIAKLDKTEPVYVYCLSGGRSASAAETMRNKGFKQVYEMEGGMMKWRASGLPEVKGEAPGATGMTRKQYDALLNTDKLVLMDFYADWCGPCKQMAPYLEELKTEMADKLTIVRINADGNEALMKDLQVEGLPTLIVYKDKKQTWRNLGFVPKEEVVAHLK